jgi:hypothetical protein
MYLLIIPGIIFLIHALITSRFFNKRLLFITAINSFLFGIFIYVWHNTIDGFRNNVDAAFKDGKTYYYNTVPTTDKCETGDKDQITFYYNNGTEEKHVDTSNNSYTCKKLTLTSKALPIKNYGGRGGQVTQAKSEPITKYLITPLTIIDPSFNCPESLDYNIDKGRCFTPNYDAYRNSCPDYDKVNDACLTANNDKNVSYDPYYNVTYNNDYVFPKRYKCPHAIGKINITYPGQNRNNDVYHCDTSGNKQVLNNDKVCPNGMRSRRNVCR